MFYLCSRRLTTLRQEGIGVKLRNRFAILLAGAAVAAAATAIAAETIVYRYDARGRLVRVERGANINGNVANVATDYTFDKADNRTAKTTAGSPNPPPP